jgi:hypothetical protein
MALIIALTCGIPSTAFSECGRRERPLTPNNCLSSSRDQLSDHQADAKVDWRPSNEDTASGRWSIRRYEAFGSQGALPVLRPKYENSQG